MSIELSAPSPPSELDIRKSQRRVIQNCQQLIEGTTVRGADCQTVLECLRFLSQMTTTLDKDIAAIEQATV